ncbi:RrF2 family transcriptional regulator [Actinophytocola sediminis]
MRMAEGVEWALHSCLNLSWTEVPVPAARLAAYFDLPAPYLNKQLQALARAGIVHSTSGPRGGFRLDRTPAKITMLDVVVAIEGPEPAFRCAEILHGSPFGDRKVNYVEGCVVSRAMSRAELSWRRELAATTIADLAEDVERTYPGSAHQSRDWLAKARS